MGAKTVLFLALFVLCSGGALFVPLLGILGYVAHYIIGPERQWWTVPVRPWGIRYSFTLALLTGIGVAIHWRKLRFGRRLLTGQEKLLLVFLALTWLLRSVSEETTFYTVVDHPAVKLAKVVLFCLMLTHVVTNLKELNALLWVLVVCTFILGLQAYDTPRSAFQSGRLESIGGVDFAESNFLPAFIVGVLPLMGVLFLRSGWGVRVFVLVAGAFAANAIMLTRSRGALVGIGLGGIMAVMFAPKGYRVKIMSGLIVASLGLFYLMDPGFKGRASTINAAEGERDVSAEGRLETWEASIACLKDHPQGIGPGNFFQVIGRYNAKYIGRDAHNTFVRCFTELGVLGLALFVGLIVHALWIVKRTMRKARDLPPDKRDRILYPTYGFGIGLCMMLGCGLTVTLLYTEALWWFLMVPVCLERAVANMAVDAAARPAAASSRMLTGMGESPGSRPRRRRPRAKVVPQGSVVP